MWRNTTVLLYCVVILLVSSFIIFFILESIVLQCRSVTFSLLSSRERVDDTVRVV